MLHRKKNKYLIFLKHQIFILATQHCYGCDNAKIV